MNVMYDSFAGVNSAKVVMVDVRYSRDQSHHSDNDGERCGDSLSMLGDNQWAWLQNELLSSPSSSSSPSFIQSSSSSSSSSTTQSSSSDDSTDILFLVTGIQLLPPLVTTSSKHPLCAFVNQQRA